nr:MAG TPA: hypothetical protein [Bacteriophage sp.]
MKKFSQKFLMRRFQYPPTFVILYSRICEKLFPKSDLNFVQICPEKLMKNFNRLKCII